MVPEPDAQAMAAPVTAASANKVLSFMTCLPRRSVAA
jgi:hypothetical protein